MYKALVSVAAMFLFFVALLPYIIARQRDSIYSNWIRKLNSLLLLFGIFGSIFIPDIYLNLYFGFLGLVWISMLLWAIMDRKRVSSEQEEQPI